MIRGLRPAFAGLLAATSLAWPQRPSDADADALIVRSREKALAYARSLPDFVCTEVVRRYIDTRRTGRWIPSDTLTIKLTYFQQKEEHTLLEIDDKPTSRNFEGLEGAIGVGEFGGVLRSIFEGQSGTAFHWESWKNVRKHRTAVYAYAVPLERSHYVLETGVPGSSRQAIAGYHGVLEIDSDTGEVLHFTYLADHISKELDLEYAVTTVDYDFADVGGHDYLLPARSETRMRSSRVLMWNQMEFREYRKFSTESIITFGPGK